ncbi:ABC transporter permease [soil metagenome]
MIWLSWRQLRTEILILLVVLIGLAALFVPTGLRMHSNFRDNQLAACVAAPVQECDGVIDQFENRFATVDGVTDWFALLPVLFAALIAAPFVLELERRSYRLAWTQSISRNRWAATKLGTIVVGTLVSSALLSLLLTWWRRPLDRIQGRLDPGVFQIEGLALPMYCLFGAALVVACGTVLRRTVPTIVIAAVVFIVIRVVIETWVRPHYQSAQTLDTSNLGTISDTAWVLSRQTNVDGSVTVHYHSGNRFWPFQLIESALYLALSSVLIAFSAFWLLRRVD